MTGRSWQGLWGHWVRPSPCMCSKNDWLQARGFGGIVQNWPRVTSRRSKHCKKWGCEQLKQMSVSKTLALAVFQLSRKLLLHELCTINHQSSLHQPKSLTRAATGSICGPINRPRKPGRIPGDSCLHILAAVYQACHDCICNTASHL